MKWAVRQGMSVMGASGELTMNCDPRHAQNAIPKDINGVNCPAAEEDKKKGEVVGTALVIADRGDEKGSASEKIKGYQLGVSAEPRCI